MNVVLIGLRGSGKSTVGVLLAEALKREFVDCDDVIEKKTMLSIAEIIRTCGEAYFRLLESEVVEELSRTNGKVISAGGGAVLRYRNVMALKRNGVVVLLEVDPDTAWERISADPSTASRRPALTRLSGSDELRELAHQRRSYYLKAADHVVQTDERVPDQVVLEILSQLKSRPDAPASFGG